MYSYEVSMTLEVVVKIGEGGSVHRNPALQRSKTTGRTSGLLALIGVQTLEKNSLEVQNAFEICATLGI